MRLRRGFVITEGRVVGHEYHVTLQMTRWRTWWEIVKALRHLRVSVSLGRSLP